MRLAMVVTGGLHPSGREQVVPSLLALFERLARTHEVHAFALRHLPQPQTYDLRGITVHDLGRPTAPLGLRRRAQGRALYRSMAAVGSFDVIHGFWADPAGLIATRAGRRFNIPSIVTCDSGEFVSIPEIGYGSQQTFRARARVREACQRSNRVHVCTEFMRLLALKNQNVNAVVIPLGIVCGGEAVARSHQPGQLRLLQVAGLSHVKNQVVLIEAVALLARDLDVRLDLAGDDTLDRALHAYAHDLGVADRVTFHGHIANDQLAPLFAAADIYVQSSKHEAAAVSVLEAAAAGVPVVGTRVGYVSDWAADKALAVGAATPQALASAIRTLHTDKKRADQMALAAQAWSRAHDADWTAAQFDQLYQELVRRR
jgi:glycosyltransferase involved in cell wall biosynthesis